MDNGTSMELFLMQLFEKKQKHIFHFVFVWDPMEAKISKRYSFYKSQPKVLNFSRIFFRIVVTKLRLEFLKIKNLAIPFRFR